MKIAITTPTGNIGGALTKLLLDAGGHELTLLARDTAKVAAHAARGAKVAQADVLDREAVIKATAGAEAVFLLSPPKFDAEDFRAYQNQVGDNFAAAIRANKPKRVVFLSSFGAQHKEGTGPITGLYDIEQKLNAACKETGTAVIHLRPGYFLENWFMNVPTIKQAGAVYAPIGPDVKWPMIATSDIARVAFEVITGPAWQGVQVRELLGAADVSLGEGVKKLSELTGKPIQFVQVPGEAAKQAMIGMGLGASIAGKYVEMYEAAEKGLLEPESKRDGRQYVTFEQFAKAALAPAIKN
jgi:uncharacterized protein YbjT (DUF2867 family)